MQKQWFCLYILLLLYSTICNGSPTVRLTVSNGTNSDETIILFNSNSTSGFDVYDSEKMFVNSSNYPEIYTRCAGNDLVINCLPTVQTNPSVTLGFVTAKAGSFTIQATEITGLDNVIVILEDTYLHSTQNLHTKPTYTFTSEIYSNTDRFIIHFHRINTWNGIGNWTDTTYWSMKTSPEKGDNIVIASGTLTANETDTISELTIQNGAHLTINAGDTITVSGNAIFQTGATILENGKLSVTGTTTVEQYLTGAGTTTPSGRFWYVASPVTGATSSTFDAAGDNRLWNYDETAHAYSEITNNTSSLAAGTGYVARLGADQTVSFSGTLTSGNLTINPTRTGTTDAKRGFNLIGNPYPSYLNWDAAYATASNMLPTIWYRTINTSSTMVFDTYNASGSVGTNNNGSGAVTAYIPPMQAVWVKVSGDGNTGTLSLTNSMRSHQTGTLKEDVAYPVVRLAVSNGTNTDEAIAVFADSASNGFDKFDSPKMSNNNVHVPELYMTADSEQVAINGLKPFEGTDSIPFGFRSFERDTFSVSLGQFDGFDGYQAILIDNITKDSVVLNNTDYSFVADSGDNASRFTLVLKATTETTGISPVTQSGITIKTAGSAIVVSSAVLPATISVSDILGRTVVSSVVAASPASIEVPVSGVYFVTVTAGAIKETAKVVVSK